MSFSKSLSFGFALISTLAGFASSARADDRIAIPATINTHPVTLIVDTGAGADVLLWQTVTASLGLTVTPPAADLKLPPGQIPLGVTNPTDITVLGKTFPARQLGVIAIPAYVPSKSHGLVGWTAIRESRQSFQVAERRVVTVADLPSEKDGWLRFATRVQANLLELVLGSPGHPEIVLIDTGSPDGIKLAPDKWRAWRAAHPRSPTTRMAYFNPHLGVVAGDESWDDDFELAGLRLRGVAVGPTTGNELDENGIPFTMIVGLKALERFDLVVDGRAGIALARALSGLPVPYEHNRLGAVFIPRDAASVDLIASVAAGTPAARAGLRDGDVLLAIDQLDVTPWRTQAGILPLARFWSQPTGTKLALQIRRAGQTVSIKATLADILGPPSHVK